MLARTHHGRWNLEVFEGPSISVITCRTSVSSNLGSPQLLTHRHPQARAGEEKPSPGDRHPGDRDQVLGIFSQLKSALRTPLSAPPATSYCRGRRITFSSASSILCPEDPIEDLRSEQAQQSWAKTPYPLPTPLVSQHKAPRTPTKGASQMLRKRPKDRNL